MCVIIQWDRVYQDGRREPQEELHYCPHRHDPGHNNVIEIRTLQDEHVVSPPRTFPSNTSRATGMAEYPIIEPRAQPGASAEQRTDRSKGKKKRQVVTNNDRYKLDFRFHIPFTRKTPKSKKEPKADPPVIHVVDPPQPSSRPTVTYLRPQQFAAGPYQPYEQPRRHSFDRRYDYTAYPAEPGRPAETYQQVQNPPAVEVLPSLSAERRSRSRDRRRTVNFQAPAGIPVPPPIVVGASERPATTIVVPEESEDSPPPVFREHTSRPRPAAVVLTRSPSRERRPRARSSTPAPRIPVREHGGRHVPRAPTPPRRNHSPRRLRRIEEDIRRVESDLRSARRQARLEDARSREQRLARVERDLQRLYDQQDAEIELEQQLRVVRDSRAAFEAGRRERIMHDRTRPLSIHQTDHRVRTERDLTRDRNDFGERGTRVINQAITNRREERENRDRRGDRRENRAVERRDERHELRREVRRVGRDDRREERPDDRREDRRGDRREERRVERREEIRVERRESSAHRSQRDRNRSNNVQRRNTISGNDHLIWDDDRERRRRRFF